MERTGSSSSWFDGDFEDDEDDAFLLAMCEPEPVVKKRVTPKPSSGPLNGKRRKIVEDMLSWCDRYAPLTPHDLAVQPKKVQEIRSWLIQALSSKNARCVLALVGPSGCGKTASVKALAKELNLHLRLWVEKDNEESKVQAFSSFIRQASKYKSLLEDVHRKNLVLLEEWPSSISKEGVEEILLRLGGIHSPLILIFSEDGARNTDLLEALSAHKISLNPITNTNMVKALKRIASAESASGVRSFSVPEQAALLSLAEACKGDIRAAIHSLQFKCSSNEKPSLASKGKERREVLDIKDPSLDLFHALGKVLYAKRTTERETFPVPHSSFRRNVLKSSPQDILDFAPISHEGLTSFLHQNYIDFFQDIGELSSASEYLSLSDEFFVWNLNALSSKVQLSEFGGHLAVRGLLFHNQSKVKSFGGLKTFSKPDVYGAMRNAQSKSQKACSRFRSQSLSSKELFTTFLPLLSKISSSFSWDFSGMTYSSHQNDISNQAQRNEEKDLRCGQNESDADEEDFMIEEFD